MFSDMDMQKLIVSVSGKKAAITADQTNMDELTNNLPPEVAALLASMQNPGISAEAMDIMNRMQNSGHTSNTTTDKINISDTNPDLRSIVEKEINEINSAKAPESQELVRARSAEMQVALDRQQALEAIRNAQDLRSKLTIYECGVALGIIVGSSTKKEVDQIMEKFSKIACPSGDNDLMFFYSDIYVTVFYNDDMVVRELQFGDYYKGQTSQGLQIGDSLEKAVELYGQPRMKSPRGAIWNKFGVFSQNNLVSSIRIQS